MITAEKKYKSGLEYHLQRLSNYFSSPIELEKNGRLSGIIGWGTLAALIIAYDIYAIKSEKIETLTRSFWRLSESKIAKFPVLVSWAVLTLHLVAEKDIRKKISK